METSTSHTKRDAKMKCIVHGCCKSRFTPPIKRGQLQLVCQRHYYATKSGRVGAQWRRRDIHNFHRRDACEWCARTAWQIGNEICARMSYNDPSQTFRIRDIIREGMKVLQGDHINGRDIRKAHWPENIQTLCANCHKIKTVVEKDHVPRLYRR